MSDIKSFSPLWDKWEIESEIGSGLYGTVYKIKAEENGQQVLGAVKHISIDASDNSKEIQEVFEGAVQPSESTDEENQEELSPAEKSLNKILEEIETNYSFVRSKNLLIYEEHAVYEKDDSKGYDIFIRMPYYESLSDILKSSDLDFEQKLKLAIDMCSALGDLEAKKVFHGDIKPENIFRNSKGQFLLADFGITKKPDNIVNKKAVKQTVAFMAPELQENKAAKNTADIYSLGLLLYKLFNNNNEPFLKDNATAEEKSEAILKRIKGVTFPAPCNADKNLAKIILIACQFSPDARWMNASAFKNALLAYEPATSNGSAVAGVAAGAGAGIAGAAILGNEKSNEDTDLLEEVPDDNVITNDDIDAFDSDFSKQDDDFDQSELSDTTSDDITNIEDQATKAFSIPNEKDELDVNSDGGNNHNGNDDYDSSTDPEFAFDDDDEEHEKKGKGKTVLLIVAILLVLCVLGAVVFFAIQNDMFGGKTATADTATTVEATTAVVETQPHTTVPPTTAKPTEKETENPNVSVPYIVGMDYSAAMDELAYVGLSVSIDSYAYSDYYDYNAIIEVTPSEGASVQRGDTVSIVVSQGARPEETQAPEPTDAASSRTPSSSTEKTGGYVLSGSDSRYIDKSEVSSMDERTMTIALNEIYARHGRIFTTPYLVDHFNSKTWYEPLYSASEYASKIEPTHNDYEKKNIATIVEVMSEKGYR